MELLALDALLIAGAAAIIRWAIGRPVRFVPLVAATGSAAAFTVVRNRYGFEDSSFLVALAVSSLIAAAIAAVGCAAFLRSIRLSMLYTGFAVVLVPVLFCASIAFRLGTCLVTGCELS